MNKGFTLIELIIVIAVTAILSGVILFSITKYISKGKDSSISGNMAVLVPAGEAYYNIDNTYAGFCDIGQDSGSTVLNTVIKMPKNINGSCYSETNSADGNTAGLCCNVAQDGGSWAACAKEFANPNMANCVDSRGVKEEMDASLCGRDIILCP